MEYRGNSDKITRDYFDSLLLANRIKEMTSELAAVMARTGIADLTSFDASVIHKREF